MQYPQDGGVSAIRFLLRDREHELAGLARRAVGTEHADAGRLVCRCGADRDWCLHRAAGTATLVCECNDSSLPLYIGAPPYVEVEASVIVCPRCTGAAHGAAVAVGYPVPVPPLGTLEAERAQALAVALECAKCGTRHVGWSLLLAGPAEVRGDEAWLGRVQAMFRR